MSRPAHDGDAPLVIVGNALAGLVCADERARRGRRTVLINPGGPWGGYFAGLQAGGRRWDLGTVLCEFTSFRTPATPPALASYEPARRNDIGRFTGIVRDYLSRQAPMRDIAPMQMWTGSRWLPDLLLGNGLDALPQLPCAAAARDELRQGLARRLASPWHARHKSQWPEQGPMCFDEVSAINHGRVLHGAVFAPFARQVMHRDAGHIAALFHRIPWLPMYWPETLLAALEGRPTGLPATVYSHAVGACLADLCAALFARLATSNVVRLIEARVHRLEPLGGERHAVTLEGGDRLFAARLAWALTPRQALVACGEPVAQAVDERLPLRLALLAVPRNASRRDFSVAHSLAADSGIYRVTQVDGCAGDETSAQVHLAVEAHPARFAAVHGEHADEPAVIAAVLRDLATMGLLADGTRAGFSKLLDLPAALPLPTPQAIGRHLEEQQRMSARLPAVHRLSASAGAFATSLSDQIVQGLQLAELDAVEGDTGDMSAADACRPRHGLPAWA